MKGDKHPWNAGKPINGLRHSTVLRRSTYNTQVCYSNSVAVISGDDDGGKCDVP